LKSPVWSRRSACGWNPVHQIGALIAISQRNYKFAQGFGLILVAGLFSLLVNAPRIDASVLRRHAPSAASLNAEVSGQSCRLGRSTPTTLTPSACSARVSPAP
jgi:hypothetical protein